MIVEPGDLPGVHRIQDPRIVGEPGGERLRLEGQVDLAQEDIPVKSTQNDAIRGVVWEISGSVIRMFNCPTRPVLTVPLLDIVLALFRET